MLRIIILLLCLTSTQMFAQKKLLRANISIAGHRGGYYFQHPESSIPLFEFLGKAFGNDTILVELDIRKSKSGTLYLMHDETVDRTTNGTGKITDLDDDYLNKLFLKNEINTLTTERIPTFKKVLEFIKNKNINLMLDIKVSVHEEVYALVKQHNLESRMLTLTFNMDLTKKVAALSNQISLSALIESENDWQQFKDVPMVAGKKIAYTNSKTPAALIQELKRNNVKVMADVSEALRNNNKPLDKAGYQYKVKDQQLDILITDYPIEARTACKTN